MEGRSMTTNRIHKAQVRALAKLNNITYVEAKRQLRIIQGIETSPREHLPTIERLPEKKLEAFAKLNKGIPLGTVSALLPENLDDPDSVSNAFRFFTWPAESSSKILTWDPTMCSSLSFTGRPGSGKTVFAKQVARYGRAAGYETLFFSDRPMDYANEVGLSTSELPIHEQLEEILVRRIQHVREMNHANDQESKVPQSLLFIDADLSANDFATAQLRATYSRLSRLGRSLGLYCIAIAQHKMASPYPLGEDINVGSAPVDHREPALGSAWFKAGLHEYVNFALGQPESTLSKDHS